MTWYYVPSESLASVPAQGVSTSECMTLWADALERSAMWNTKPLPAKSWLRVFKTTHWMMRRFGQTSTPSMLAAGAAAWMESLEATPASPFPSLESASGSMTPGTSGRRLSESLMSADLVGASSRTWLDTFGSDTSTLLNQASNALATGSRKASSRRRKSAPRTSANGSSSWPTARADTLGTRPNGNGGKILAEEAEIWSTPHAHNAHGAPGAGLTANDGRHRDLVRETAMWPTPRSEDSESAGNHPGATDSLTGATSHWPTPVANDDNQTAEAHLAKKPGRTVVTSLNIVAKDWQTPASDSFRSRGGDRKDEPGLDQQARYWATPLWSDAANAGSLASGSADTMLWRQASQRFPLDPQTEPHGSESSQPGPTSRRPSASTRNGSSASDSRLLRRRLNPRFVAWLMGWQPGWTSLEPLDCGSPGTESSPPRPHSPFAPSGDNWPTPDTQNARTGAMRAEAHGKHAMSLHHVVEEWRPK